MPVGRIRAFRSKQCPFWVNFGYVVSEIKYAPKLVELISNNGYGLYFMKSSGALAAKIIDIDRQQGAGLLFISPLGVHMRYVVRLHFLASNNMAEYEALLSGLRIAPRRAGRLSTHHRPGHEESSCHDPKMEAYCNAVRR